MVTRLLCGGGVVERVVAVLIGVLSFLYCTRPLFERERDRN